MAPKRVFRVLFALLVAAAIVIPAARFISEDQCYDAGGAVAFSGDVCVFGNEDRVVPLRGPALTKLVLAGALTGIGAGISYATFHLLARRRRRRREGEA